MKRSQTNGIYREAAACFERHGWALSARFGTNTAAAMMFRSD
jgi:hypothetical protein